MNEPVLEVTDLGKRYGGRTAVDGLSLSVPAGTVVALLGPNGAGKTTTVEVCEGFRTPDAGSVRVLGGTPAQARARVGVMPQGGGGYPGLQARELLTLFSRFYAQPHDPAELLSLLGLDEVARTPYRRLSGGQQQRLSLAMAVVGRPELVYLDEPTAGLDPQARRATWDLVEKLRADGVTVLLTTHLMDEAEHLADEVYVIDHGRLVSHGTVPELTASSQAFVRFTGPSGLDVEDLLLSLGPDAVGKESPAGTYLVEGPEGPQLLAGVTAWCATRGVLPEGLQTRRTLEDVFLDLTGRELRP
ncbi:MAG: ABC transporter ATP-binding protein [Mycobacteriales bacterium]